MFAHFQERTRVSVACVDRFVLSSSDEGCLLCSQLHILATLTPSRNDSCSILFQICQVARSPMDADVGNDTL